jgi:OOP family OmpA-OmpF porin
MSSSTSCPGLHWRPFIGAGLGTAWVHNKAYGQLSGVPPGAALFQNTSFDDVDQASPGKASWAWPGTSRELVAGPDRPLPADHDLQWGSVTTNAGGRAGGAVTDVGTFSGKYKDTSVTLGLRYTFGSPAAAPPPPAAPAAAASAPGSASAPAAASGRSGL